MSGFRNIWTEAQEHSGSHTMTTLAYWAGYDNKGITSIYIATDSRFKYSYSNGKADDYSDNSQKSFHSSITPDIFGIYGNNVLGFDRIIYDLIDNLPVYRAMHSAEEYVSSIGIKILSTINKKNIKKPNGRIIHGFRWLSPIKFQFVEYIIKENNKVVSVDVKEIKIKVDVGFDGSYKQLSELVSFCYPRASGSESLYAVISDDKDRSQRGFSRWHWQVFCDHINDPKDDYTGGAPQLVGLYEKWNGINFGIYFNSIPYIDGKRIGATGLCLIPDGMKWHDELFQRINKYGELVDGAQRHARITSEPRIELLIT